MQTDKQDVIKTRIGLRRFRFSIRGLFSVIVVAAFAVASIQYAWPRRTVSSLIAVQTFDVQIFGAHVQEIAENSKSIIELRIDRPTNSFIVMAQARNIDTATRDAEWFITNPIVVTAADSLGVTVQKARELLVGS